MRLIPLRRHAVTTIDELSVEGYREYESGISVVARVVEQHQGLKRYWLHVRLEFKPEDCWVGAYYDKRRRTLYVCLLPTLPIVLWVGPCLAS